jgi:NAD(P)-dependent dehydrogenase (short-subunit alcohol dehydrogenase family)
MRKILVIGASSGIGKQIAQELTNDGHHVIGTFNKTPPSPDAGPEFHHLNVMEEKPELSFLPEALDGLVYCPGSINLKPFARISEQDLVQDFQLHLVGAVKVIQAALQKLKNGKSPSIVLISTVAVQTGFPFHALVASSKGALEGLTKALAAEFAPAIRVNCIAPSITDTPLSKNILSTDEKKILNGQRHPLKRIGAPEDVANAATFLLSEKSGWVTGQILHVDGGISSLKI